MFGESSESPSRNSRRGRHPVLRIDQRFTPNGGCLCKTPAYRDPLNG
jgi:hypothetical protein